MIKLPVNSKQFKMKNLYLLSFLNLIFQFATLNSNAQCAATYTDTIAMILHDGINCIDYPIVKIGSKWWMAENVNATQYADGTSLIDGSVAGDITGDFTSKYYFNYNNDNTNSLVYGKLYTWAATMNGSASSTSIPSGVQGVCPTGWYIPGDAEWKQLEMSLGMTQAEADNTLYRGTDEGGKLKETGTIHWLNPNEGATNSSGFTALPGGYRATDGSFLAVGTNANWWAATEFNSTYGWVRDLNYSVETVYRGSNKKTAGISVRCVKGIDLFTNLTISVSKTDASHIYPNPSGGSFNLKNYEFENLKMKSVDICNVLGEKIYHIDNFQINTSSNFQIDLSNQPDGIYYISIVTEQGTQNQKLIIKK